MADQEARNRGYTAEDARLASFAVVAFLDESVLNLQNPVFAGWPRKPLQEEMFGGHVAGEIFYQSLQRLLERSESAQTRRRAGSVPPLRVARLPRQVRGRRAGGAEIADGRCGAEDPAHPKGPRHAVAGLGPGLRRGVGGQCRPSVSSPVDRGGSLRASGLLLFGGFKMSLGSGVSDLQTAVAETRR